MQRKRCVLLSVLFGYNRIGYDLLKSFKKLKKKYLVVDYNPETIQKLTKKNIKCRYGDVDDSEFIDELNLARKMGKKRVKRG